MMETSDDEENRLRSVALQNAQSILLARQRAEEELLRTKEALERKTEELAQQREWFQTTLSSIGDAVIATDTHGEVTFLNPVAEKLTGWNSPDAAGQSLEKIFNIINEVTRRPAANPIRQVLQKGITMGLANHTALISRAGMEISIEDSAAPIKDSGGKISGAVMVFHDVTERRRAEETQARLAAIVENSDDGIIGKTLDSIITSWNLGAERILGYRAEEMIGQSITKIIPVERHEEETFILGQLRQGQGVEHYETLRLTKDGQRIDVSLTSSPIRNAEGQIIGASTILRDITEYKRSQEALRGSEERLRAIFNQAAVGIALAELNGRFFDFNEKFTQILGYTRAELQQMTFTDITHPEDLARTRDNVSRLLAGEIPDYAYEKRYLRKDGVAVWSLTTVTLLKDADGKPQRFIGVIEDITPRKQAELERARLSNVLEKSLNEIYIFDPETLRFQYVNQGAMRNLDYSPEAMATMTPLDLKPEFTEAAFREMVRPLLQGEKEKHVFRTVHRRRDGSHYPVEVHLQAVAHAGQQVFLAVILDITQRTKAEEALRQSEQFNRTIIESSRDCNKILSLDGSLLWISETEQEALGHRRSRHGAGQVVDRILAGRRPRGRARGGGRGGTKRFGELHRLFGGERRTPVVGRIAHAHYGSDGEAGKTARRLARRHRTPARRGTAAPQRRRTACPGRLHPAARVDGAAGRPHLLVQPPLVRVHRHQLRADAGLGLAVGARSGNPAAGSGAVEKVAPHRRAFRHGISLARRRRPVPLVPHARASVARRRRARAALVRHQYRRRSGQAGARRAAR